ncbi:MAG: FAD-binding protein [Rhizobiaceae bacterium]|nr:FAD-binding protein [Rhizobiaceae bacterium]
MTVTAGQSLMLPGLERQLRREITGDVHFDRFSRGRYATDASIYQMMPVGVIVPRNQTDIEAAISLARAEGVPVLARGGGTSQSGQTVNNALVIDTSKYFCEIIELDVENQRCRVQPGIVLDELNRALKPHGLWFPVDVSTASRATIGGMAANNSCGGRSIRYGTMRDNVLSIDGVMADGTRAHFGADAEPNISNLSGRLLELGRQQADEIAQRFPKVIRRVGGYNIDALVPGSTPNNLSHLLVGSEGTLVFSSEIELKLSPLISSKVMGVCHFASFHEAMDATQHLVKLKPQAVELVDSTMIALAREIPIFRKTVEQFVKGDPEALLLVEFAELQADQNVKKLDQLDDAMAELGFSFKGTGKKWGGVVDVVDPTLQDAIAEVRKSGLNIMMSMKDAGKPVSFVEDCAVELPDLAEYTAGLTEIFERHGTTGTWYAHASVGCLHVRPILNMKLDKDVATMRSIAEQAFDLVAKYKGSHSGEHGDGIVRSEFHEKMFGSTIVSAFEEVKNLFDPNRLFNPGKIVKAPKMDDRKLFRYGPDYSAVGFKPALDWSPWPGAAGGFLGAVEMCNNNGACRKLKGGTMCPSYRITRNEKDVTRGRANSLRLALTGQLGEEAITSDEMLDTMKLCVSCKGCQRECPTGVDMAAMKIEVQAAHAAKNGISLHDKLVAYLPRYAGLASRLPWVMNLRNKVPGLAKALERIAGFSAHRQLPAWRGDALRDSEYADPAGPDVVFFADTFNRYFEPENLRAAVRVLSAAGVTTAIAKATEDSRPLCCGRTFLSTGLVDQAKEEATRLLAALVPHARAGRFIVGLEPSCLLTLRDEIPRLLPGPDSDLVAQHALLFEEFVAHHVDAEILSNQFVSPAEKILLHGHCHQKAAGVMSSVEQVLGLLPNTTVETVETSCCGMAGSFGYKTDTHAISMKMGELDLFPAVRAQAPATLVVADGTSCRHQIADGTQTTALHVARVLELSLPRQDTTSDNSTS